MPEITLLYLAIVAVVLVLGGAGGWLMRSNRSRREKLAISAGWQAQIDSQQSENDRLVEQNKSLMQQVSQYQASNRDSTLRARELSEALKETFQRRDELQRQLKDIRGNLEVAITQRDKLREDVNSTAARGEAHASALREKDERIARLRKELENWQARVPPLVERYRQRDLEAQQLEVELQKAGERIAQLENLPGGDETRIESLGSDALPDGLDASNEPHGDTTLLALQELDDQIDSTRAAMAGADAAAGEPDEDADSFAEDAQPGNRGAAVHEDTDEDDNEDNPEDDSQDGDEPQAGTTVTDGGGYDYAFDSWQSATGRPDSGSPMTADADADLADDDTAVADAQPVSSAGNGIDDGGTFPGMFVNPYATETHPHDDLKQIKGVGPAIEKLLNDLGIFRYTQIAEMTEYDIDRVAHQLKGFRSRIYREDWIGQARTLELDKHSH